MNTAQKGQSATDEKSGSPQLNRAGGMQGESPRVLWRLNTLRGLSHDEVKQVFT